MTEYRNPIPMTDVLAEHHDGTKDGLVLITRDREPYEDTLALPGGFAEEGISLLNNARKECCEETGLQFVPYRNSLWSEHSAPDRDPRGHRTTTVYYGRAYGDMQFGSDARDARVYTGPELVSMLGSDLFAFDHEGIIKEYLVHKGYLQKDKNFGTVGAIGRFRPLHAGSATLLEELCEQSERAVIGIGSANMPLSSRNPWSAQEVADMVDAHLSQRYSNFDIALINDYGHIPEYRDGQRWKQEVLEKMQVDSLVSGNKWVQDLLSDSYNIIDPKTIIPQERRIQVRGSFVRQRMASGDIWKSYVPPAVVDYVTGNSLDERFREEFGEQVLDQAHKAADSVDSVDEERRRIAQNS